MSRTSPCTFWLGLDLTLRLPLKLGASALLALASQSCQWSPTSGEQLIHPDLKRQLAWSPVSPRQPLTPSHLWRGPDQALTYSGSPQKLDASITDLGKKWVMVSFPSGSSLGVSLKTDPLTLAYDSGTSTSPGHALVAIPDPLHQEALALAAHSAAGHVCGAIERVDYGESFSLLNDGSQDKPIIAPVWAETVALSEVQRLTEGPTLDGLRQSIQTLEALGTRFHTTASGENAPATVKDLWTTAAQNRIAGFALQDLETPDSRQSSVIAAIPGQSDDQTTVIIGAHLDSINRAGSTEGAPGADDDASGIATLVEMIRAIGQSGARFQRRVEFHAYAAEEVGLEGSIAVAKKYASEGRKVAAMMQFDMNAWSQSQDDTIHFVTTTTTPYLTRAAKDLTNTYLQGRFSSAALSAGTSDHKSWYLRGFPVVFPFENPAAYNQALHSANDTSATINSLPLALRMARLGLAFVAHEAGLVIPATTAAAALAKTRTSLPSDLKVAVVPKSGTSDAYVILATGLSTLKSVEICRTNAKGSMTCTHQRLGSSQTATRQGRTFYQVDLALKLSEGDRLAIFGYDQAEALVAQRTIRLTAR